MQSILCIGCPKRNCIVVLLRDSKRIISRLKEEGSFYNVPRHINDDWFVIYATLCGKRYDANISAKGHDWKPIYAVSNDMCRDHKLSFLSPR